MFRKTVAISPVDVRPGPQTLLVQTRNYTNCEFPARIIPIDSCHCLLALWYEVLRTVNMRRTKTTGFDLLCRYCTQGYFIALSLVCVPLIWVTGNQFQFCSHVSDSDNSIPWLWSMTLKTPPACVHRRCSSCSSGVDARCGMNAGVHRMSTSQLLASEWFFSDSYYQNSTCFSSSPNWGQLLHYPCFPLAIGFSTWFVCSTCAVQPSYYQYGAARTRNAQW